jgi:hypothetical protein
MDRHRFDALAKTLGGGSTRRGVLTLFVPSGLAMRRDRVAAKKRNKKRRKAPPLNQFGCLDVGRRCRKTKHCCSGICAGPENKKRCRSHDVGGCPVAEVGSCFNGACTTRTGDAGLCMPTTGNAGYCGADSTPCIACNKDADCRERCGSGAACVTCGLCVFAGTLTFCAGAAANSCN